MEIPIKLDDLGGKPTIFGNTHMKEFEKKTHKWLIFVAWNHHSLQPLFDRALMEWEKKAPNRRPFFATSKKNAKIHPWSLT